MAKPIEDLKQRTKMLVMGMDKAGEFYRKIFGGLLAYVSNRIPEISDEFYKIDDALKAGFGWELGPFESWDLFGYEKGVKFINDANKTMGPAIDEMRKRNDLILQIRKWQTMYFDMSSNKYIQSDSWNRRACRFKCSSR